MFAGFLNEVIEIYEFVRQKDVYGKITETKQFKCKTRAKVNHRSGSRTVINDNIQYPYTKTFVVRIYINIKEDDLIKYQDEYYRVLSIDKDKTMQQIVIEAEIVKE